MYDKTIIGRQIPQTNTLLSLISHHDIIIHPIENKNINNEKVTMKLQNL